VLVPSSSYVQHIRERYGTRIREFLDEVSSERLTLRFVVDSETSVVDVSPPVFNPRYTFNTFVVGTSNELAYAASRSISDNPNGSYNPLFIYGPSGLGKTHLLQAIGHRFLEQKRTAVYYMTGDALVSEIISAIRYDRMKEFRERYRAVDVLLIDDVHLLAGKERTQEEFFHTFNALYEAQSQIVLTSDAPPSAIPALENRLRTRFEWGLIADVQPPDLETKVAIVRAKADARKLTIANDAALFIAECARSNVRELEGHLNRVIAVAALHGKPLDLATAKEALKDVATGPQVIRPKDILHVVASHFAVKVAELKSRSDNDRFAMPRMIAMYICKQMTDLSYPEIGRLFGIRHHSTVMHSVEKVERLRADDPVTASTLEALLAQFR
jgi:chromosomal replication initiator protein